MQGFIGQILSCSALKCFWNQKMATCLGKAAWNSICMSGKM